MIIADFTARRFCRGGLKLIGRTTYNGLDHPPPGISHLGFLILGLLTLGKVRSVQMFCDVFRTDLKSPVGEE